MGSKNMIKAYNYHPEYKHFYSEIEVPQDPLDPKNYLVPKWATIVEPPEVGDGEVAVFNEITKTWEVVIDKRGTYYSISDDDLCLSIENQNPYECPCNFTQEPPPQASENQAIKWNCETESWYLEEKPQKTSQEKLQRLGLTVDDLKILLDI
jgi:hypothetical protein